MLWGHCGGKNSSWPGGPIRATVYSDALGGWDCGAFIWSSAKWLKLPWPTSWIAVLIAAKEVVPIVASLAVDGPGALYRSSVTTWQWCSV